MIPVGYTSKIHSCEKTCGRKTKPDEAKHSKVAVNFCINPSNHDKNIYQYCQTTFKPDVLLEHNCNIDTCRLCCATVDQALGTINSVSTVNDCFSQCANKFVLSKKDLLTIRQQN